MIDISGVGFSEGGSAVEVAVDGQAVPLLGVTAADMTIQIPWSMNSGEHSLTLNTHADSPFQLEPVSLTVGWPVPAILSTGIDEADRPNTVAVHEDWSGPVTLENPAKVGEVVHLYATGLGPVTPALADGQPGGADPASATLEKMTCTFYRDVAAEWCGRASGRGWSGVYQVDLRIRPRRSRAAGSRARACCGGHR